MGEFGQLGERLFDADSSGSWSTVRQTFRTAVQNSPDTVETLLASVWKSLAADHLPARARPYVHVNGFTKLLVAEFPATGTRLTFHYWPAESGKSEVHHSRPHDHRFAFSSVLLTGMQNFVEFSVEPGQDESPFRELQYRPHFGGRLAWVRRRRDVDLRARNLINRNPVVDLYEVTADVVHSAATTTRAACATLVLRGPRVRQSAHVYYPLERVTPGALTIQVGQRISVSETCDQVRSVLRVL